MSPGGTATHLEGQKPIQNHFYRPIEFVFDPESFAFDALTIFDGQPFQ